MLEFKTDNAVDAGYEQDLTLWYARQAELMRERRFDELDLENVIEELDVAGKNLRRELHSPLRVLLMHLLKCQFQDERISGSSRGTLAEQRDEIAYLVKDSPSLRPAIMEIVTEEYPKAVHRAAAETGLPESTFPSVNPYSRDHLLDKGFIP